MPGAAAGIVLSRIAHGLPVLRQQRPVFTQNFRGEDRPVSTQGFERLGGGLRVIKSDRRRAVARPNLGLDLEALHQRAPV